jgi:hypothetical protein
MSHVQPVTFLVPLSSSELIELRVAHSGLRMVLVSRESVHLLDSAWKVLGVYFLLGPADDPDHFFAYVGEVGKATLVGRAKSHAKRKDWWNRALLIASASDEFNSAEIGWLEGRLYDVLNNAVACTVMNGNRPGDASLPAHERAVLERYVEPIMAALRACGAAPDTADQKPEPKGNVTRYTEAVTDLLAAGLLKPDTVLHPLRKGIEQTARVLEDGRLDVGGVPYDSLSAAAKAVTGTVAEAGWDFWGAPSGLGGFVPLATLRARLREGNGATREAAPKAASPPTTADPAAETPASAVSDVPSPPPPPTSSAADLVRERGLGLPLPIHSVYRGERAEATIESDGTFLFDSNGYRSPSLAASAARRALGYAGVGKAATNGWTFWRFTDADGVERTLDALRTEPPPSAS